MGNVGDDPRVGDKNRHLTIPGKEGTFFFSITVTELKNAIPVASGSAILPEPFLHPFRMAYSQG
jgi:hypothetical protein